MEQALVLISIVLGVALTLELGNLDRVQRSKKVRWHWAQAFYALFVLLCVIYFWWTLAALSGEMSIGQFLPVMFCLVMLVLMSACALPDTVPEEGLKLSKYYIENHRYQWTLVLLAILPLALSWLHTLYQRDGLLYALSNGWGEWVSLLIVVWLIFVRRWWKVALGMAALSFVPIVWLSRSLG